MKRKYNIYEVFTFLKLAESKDQNGLVQGEKLIEVEKSETGSVSWQVYKHYLMSIGLFVVLITIVLNMLFQGFSIGSNVWLGKSDFCLFDFVYF